MNGATLDTWLVYTDDGQTWSAPRKIYEPQYILWKPCVHDGVFYAQNPGNSLREFKQSRGLLCV